jgi:hypothetical protein
MLGIQRIEIKEIVFIARNMASLIDCRDILPFIDLSNVMVSKVVSF